MTRPKAYLAGGMLKKGEQLLRAAERMDIEMLDAVDLFNPMDAPHNNKQSAPTAEQIFTKDTAAILESEIIVAEVDNNSVGTICEMGQVWGVNYMLSRLAEVISTSESAQDVCKKLGNLLVEVPFKEVHWHTSDIRDTNIMEYGYTRSHSYNQYLIGMMQDMAGEAMTFDQILDVLKCHANKGEL